MKQHDLQPLFATLIDEFHLKGELKDIRCIGSGNINDTYVLETSVNGIEKNYIIQKVNHKVFLNPLHIAENAHNVTTHIERKLVNADMPDIRRHVLHYYRKDDGAYYHITPEGDYWRVFSYVYNSVSVDIADLPHLYSTGRAFGEFQNYLSDFPASMLYETIPDFHNTKKRYEALKEAAKEDKFGRLEEVREEYDYLISMEDKAILFSKMVENGEIPQRVVHNDTKCNNVMFDSITGEYLAVIDLDTVMSGCVAYDFGDAVRFAANPGGEDNEDISQIYLDYNYYVAFAEGFIPCVIDKLTPLEIDTLPDGVLAITLELAARFLTDYLNGDVYFKCKKPRHNLIRTKAQIALAKDIDAKMSELRRRLKCIIDRYNL